MRLFETISIAASLFVIIGLLTGVGRRWWFLVGALGFLAAAFGLQLVFEHARWQMLPAYLVAVVLAVILIVRLARHGKPQGTSKHPKLHKLRTIIVVALGIVLLGASVVASNVFPIWQMPAPTGSFGVGSKDFEFVDTSRPETFAGNSGSVRRVMTTVWYPVDKNLADAAPKDSYPVINSQTLGIVAGLPSGTFDYTKEVTLDTVQGLPISKQKASYPVILYSPGVVSTRFQNMALVEDLVSRGYIVVGVDHPYSSGQVQFSDDTVVRFDSSFLDPTLSTEQKYEFDVRNIATRAKDLSFALDQITAMNAKGSVSLLSGAIDLDKVGVVGHSYGGATALQALVTDKRVKAGLSLEGGFWGEAPTVGVDRPFFYMIGQTTYDAFLAKDKNYAFYSPRTESDLRSTIQNSKAPFLFASVKGFSHLSFTDFPLISPALLKSKDPVRDMTITRAYAGAFFDTYLEGKQSPLLGQSSSDYPEVKFVTNPNELFR